MTTTREPLIWIQLLGIGFLPLELLFLRLILAGAPLGPLPTVQRALIALIVIIGPIFSLYKKPADWGSLLLIKLPLKSRSIKQHQISRLQEHAVPKLMFILGTALLLFSFWSIDQSALLVNTLSPFKKFSRIINLLLSTPLLFLIVWQWNQVCQSIWLLTRSEEVVIDAEYMTNQEILNRRTSLGIDAQFLDNLNINSSQLSSTIKNNQPSKQQ